MCDSLQFKELHWRPIRRIKIARAQNCTFKCQQVTSKAIVVGCVRQTLWYGACKINFGKYCQLQFPWLIPIFLDHDSSTVWRRPDHQIIWREIFMVDAFPANYIHLLWRVVLHRNGFDHFSGCNMTATCGRAPVALNPQIIIYEMYRFTSKIPLFLVAMGKQVLNRGLQICRQCGTHF